MQLEEKDTFLSRFEAAKQLYAPGCKRNATISVLIECFAGPCIDPTRDVQASSSRTSFSRNEMMLDSAGIYTGEEDASDQNLLVVELYLNKLYQQVVTDVAEESMKAAVERVKESPHHATSGEWVITDARHDSTSNAYHSTVPCLAGSSTEFVLPQVIAQGLNITEVAHGYQATIKQYVQQLGMVNSYDTWHGTKNVAKQLHRICASMVRTRDRTWFTELFDKARCTKVHLYWCMRNCGGNPDCLRAMIVNISKHFQPGYVPQRKPLTMPAAISAYEAALRKTLIYKKRLVFCSPSGGVSPDAPPLLIGCGPSHQTTLQRDDRSKEHNYDTGIAEIDIVFGAGFDCQEVELGHHGYCCHDTLQEPALRWPWRSRDQTLANSAILEAAEDNPGHTRLMHHVVVGLTWLKKRLAALGLKRRNVVETRLTLVHQAIKNLTTTSGSLLVAVSSNQMIFHENLEEHRENYETRYRDYLPINTSMNGEAKRFELVIPIDVPTPVWTLK
eukprot:Em0027g30a